MCFRRRHPTPRRLYEGTATFVRGSSGTARAARTAASAATDAARGRASRHFRAPRTAPGVGGGEGKAEDADAAFAAVPRLLPRRVDRRSAPARRRATGTWQKVAAALTLHLRTRRSGTRRDVAGCIPLGNQRATVFVALVVVASPLDRGVVEGEAFQGSMVDRRESSLHLSGLCCFCSSCVKGGGRPFETAPLDEILACCVQAGLEESTLRVNSTLLGLGFTGARKCVLRESSAGSSPLVAHQNQAA